MWTMIVVALVAFVIGAAVGRLGAKFRLARIEAELRGLAWQAYDTELLDRSAGVPASWVTNRIDEIVNKEFR